MMKKKHQPTAQDLYRARKQREEQEKDAKLPPGFINHGNTCFMNSTLQGVSATIAWHYRSQNGTLTNQVSTVPAAGHGTST